MEDVWQSTWEADAPYCELLMCSALTLGSKVAMHSVVILPQNKLAHQPQVKSVTLCRSGGKIC